MRWARVTAGLSHDKLVGVIGRSNRGHLIKIERGDHTPRPDLRNAIADATNVPRDLFENEDDEDPHRVSLDEILRLRLREIVRDEIALTHAPESKEGQ